MSIKDAVLIVNPRSGSHTRARVGRAVAAFKGAGVEVRLLYTSGPGNAELLAREAVSGGPGLIAAAGGDGTVREVINGMAGSDIPLAILPFGTSNVLARELCLPVKPEGAVRVALAGNIRQLSLGRLSHPGGEELFSLMASAGIDSETVFRVRSGLKRCSGKLAYVLTGLGVLAGWRSRDLEVSVDAESRICEHVIVSNARKYAGNFVMAPSADISSPEFEVTLLRRAGRLRLMLFAMAFFVRRHKRLAFVETLHGREVEIKGDLPVQVDGDHISMLPVRVRAGAASVRVFVQGLV